MENINEFLGLPKSSLISARMPKKAFTDNPEFELKKEEKVILKEEIDSIYFEYSLKPVILNIPKYEDDNVRYEEIEILKVKINNENKCNKVCELLQKYIQYPMLIIVEHDNFIRINTAIKKINKVDNSKLIAEHDKILGFNKWKIDISHFTYTLFRKPKALVNSTAFKQMDSILKSIYNDYFKDNEMEFILLLDCVGKYGLKAVDEAIKHIKEVCPSNISVDKIEFICTRKDDITTNSITMLNDLFNN